MQTNELRNELGTNFINYAAAVNTDRAIPDAASGLKPVARRILYGAYEGGRISSKPHVKCARIVGDVMGNYHPHGDSSIYEALVHLSQEWVMRYPLIDFHGNKGNISGDGPAASRYTEARLAPISEQGMLSGLKKKNVPFIPNYDESTEEPSTLPAVFPNLLCNPNIGIGVALACNWLPHNLGEVAAAINDYIDGKEPVLPGPDFPTGGLIINKDDMPGILATGRGTIQVRGQYKIEGKNIVFYEIPYGVTIESILTEIGQLCDDKEIEGLTNIQDESTLSGIRIVIKCTKSANIDKIITQLFNKTSLQSAISYNQVALVNKVPTELNLKQCIKIYLEHNEQCLIKETEYDLSEAEARDEIVTGLLHALLDIDNIVDLIKKSESAADACVKLVQKYQFTENQAKAIVNMRLGSLAGLEKIELQKEKEDLINKENDCRDILGFHDRRLEVIRERLNQIVKKFGDARRTQLTQLVSNNATSEEKRVATIEPENCVVILTKNGIIKRVPSAQFKPQTRNGKGIKSIDNEVIETISTNTIDTIFFFSSIGRMYRLIADDIPTSDTSLSSILSFVGNESIIAMTSLHRKSVAKYVAFFTKMGMIKKTLLSEYCGNRSLKSGVLAIKLNDNDTIANVAFVNDEDILICTKNGMSIRFNSCEVAPIGKIAIGVKAITLNTDDEVLIGLPIISQDNTIAIFSYTGLGKQINLSDFPIQKRGGKGTYCYKPCGKNDYVIGAHLITQKDKILLVGTPNSICINAKDIPLLSRTAQGNIMIKDSKLIKSTKI